MEQGDTRPCLSSHTANKYLFHNLFSAMVFATLCFLLVTSLFKTTDSAAPHGAVWSSKASKAAMYCMEKICVSDKLGSGMSNRAVGHELNANESITR